jgi:hypothetical protein
MGAWIGDILHHSNHTLRTYRLQAKSLVIFTGLLQRMIGAQLFFWFIVAVRSGILVLLCLVIFSEFR